MIRPLWQIERLRELLSQQEAEAMQSQYSQPSSKVVVEKGQQNMLTPGNHEQVTLSRDPDETPERLKGMTYMEISLLGIDGGLSEREQEWLACKNVPNPDGSLRMPNLKALMRRAQRKVENT